MHVTVVSIFDLAAGVYSRPVYTTSKGMAIRSFKDEVNRVADTNDINRHPEDFALFLLGEWDDNTGHFFGNDEGPVRLVSAVDLKED